MSEAIIRATGIEKYFSGTSAVNGVDLSVSGGEIVALVGENGAGESMLMKILAGAYQPDAGQIYFEEKRIVRIEDNVAVAKHGPMQARRLLI